VAIISTQCVRIFSISISIPFANTARRPKRRIRKQTPAARRLFPAMLAQGEIELDARKAARPSGPREAPGTNDRR
jgi:hypothetical protein